MLGIFVAFVAQVAVISRFYITLLYTERLTELSARSMPLTRNWFIGTMKFIRAIFTLSNAVTLIVHRNTCHLVGVVSVRALELVLTTILAYNLRNRKDYSNSLYIQNQ